MQVQATTLARLTICTNEERSLEERSLRSSLLTMVVIIGCGNDDFGVGVDVMATLFKKK